MLRHVPFFSLILITLLVLCTVTVLAAPPETVEPLPCQSCHVSEAPKTGDSALKGCPREKKAAEPMAKIPGIVILNELEDLYVPVRFDHGRHQNMTGMGQGCKTCHHYSPKGEKENPHLCKTCHPKTVAQEHLAQPGLKGAYHRQCLSCHMEWDKTTSCEICHEKKTGGKLHGTKSQVASGSHYQPMDFQEYIIMKTGYADNDEVKFTHKTHAESYVENCSDCHQKESCRDCHGQKNPHPISNQKNIKLHDVCNNCHKDAECNHCHSK